MKIMFFKEALKPLVIILLFCKISTAHAQNVTVTQDSKFDQLLAEKRKQNASSALANYRIQVLTGTNEATTNALSEFKKEFKNMEAIITFNTPLYKVMVGNYKTRIEAEKNLEVLKKKYPNAIILKPNK